MLSEPKIEYQTLRYYLAIAKTVYMNKISQVLPPLISEVRQWMHTNKIEPNGPDFFLYKSINENNELECEAGFTIDVPIEGNSHIHLGSFPEGKYASLIYSGDFKDMMEGHMALENWIRQKGLKEKIQSSQGVTRWGGRTEFYLIDPEFEPNPAKWQTKIMFQLEE
ncbi:GyrI-like domain-containing protein [Cytophagaceae bacterium DM2B3-1]|uniref:GyrI-like domain-containing protein n=1 Tax=Xanthocytophaga flava TaxID=3048013 RepID=A0ABT7CER2_9BACT|nr:GyrI-like domain-containing protein [Xanthocytophaga flavus]MDJ1469018.1 GyrI-like domain-containing protein [Xanthocytophaga flavus]MDJ1492196.1 GyrI-like domain-containing protein [Xanthocytophaga flavus]